MLSLLPAVTTTRIHRLRPALTVLETVPRFQSLATQVELPPLQPPLLVTVGLITGTNFNPFDGRMATLPVFAYFSFVTPGARPEPALERAWTAALVLMLIVLALNLAARLVARRFAPAGGR